MTHLTGICGPPAAEPASPKICPTLGDPVQRHCTAPAAQTNAEASRTQLPDTRAHPLAALQHSLRGLRCAVPFPLQTLEKPNGFLKFDHAAEPQFGASEAARGHAGTAMASASKRNKSRTDSSPVASGIPGLGINLWSGLI